MIYQANNTEEHFGTFQEQTESNQFFLVNSRVLNPDIIVKFLGYFLFFRYLMLKCGKLAKIAKNNEKN